MKLIYPCVSQQQPFLYITVKNVNLTQYATSVGPTQIAVYRVQKRGGARVNYPYYVPLTPIYYAPLEQSSNRFTFVLDNQLFQYCGGRYRACLQYNGVWIGDMEFEYEKPPVELDDQHGHHHYV